MKFKPGSVGFTLTELLVVLAIIGILAGLVTVNLTQARSKARDNQRRSDLSNIATALALYRSENKHYPVRTAGFGTDSWPTLKLMMVPRHLTTWPVDPKNPVGDYGIGYVYATNAVNMTTPTGTTTMSEGSQFALDATLEQDETADQLMEIEPQDNSAYKFFIGGVYRNDAGGVLHYRVVSP